MLEYDSNSFGTRRIFYYHLVIEVESTINLINYSLHYLDLTNHDQMDMHVGEGYFHMNYAKSIGMGRVPTKQLRMYIYFTPRIIEKHLIVQGKI